MILTYNGKTYRSKKCLTEKEALKSEREFLNEMEFYTYEEFKKFISVEEDIKWICLFKVLYYCSLRRGELRGLTWKNIDLEKKSLSVV